MRKTILYVEEYENTFVNVLLTRRDIRLILIRFAHCLFFTHEHLEKTKDIPTFLIDKKAPIMIEVHRLHAFLRDNDVTVDFFFNDSEFNQEYVQRVARMLSLPGALSEMQAKIVRDKMAMKDFICKIGYRCPDYQLLGRTEDALMCARNWGYPLIIKWRTGVSSIEVYRVDNQLQLLQLNLDYTSGKYMAEQFCPYKIWCIDAIVSGGQVRNNLYTWLPYTNLDFAKGKKKFAQIAVGQKPDCWEFDPYQLTQRIVSELGLSSGYLHLEAFLSHESEPIICEFAWRTPGDHMLSNFTQLYSTDIPSQIINALLGLPIETIEDSSDCVADVFLPMIEGRIVEISSLEQMKERCSILDGAVFYQAGDVLVSKHKYTDSTGWVQIRAESIGDILKKIDVIYTEFSLRVKDSAYEKSGLGH